MPTNIHQVINYAASNRQSKQVSKQAKQNNAKRKALEPGHQETKQPSNPVPESPPPPAKPGIRPRCRWVGAKKPGMGWGAWGVAKAAYHRSASEDR
jgi:hypothetical protein